MTEEQKNLFSRILWAVGESLDITKSQHEKAVEHYKAVGDFLAKPESPLAAYKPDILPQGSFLLGTMIKPINESDELDLDLVCRLEGKRPDWTQCDLKKTVGERLMQDGQYRAMLDQEGRRCWTLNYKESPKFHMDILPALVGRDYKILLERSFSEAYAQYDRKLSVRITDRLEKNYQTDKDPDKWPLSDPFGYALWFQDRATIATRKTMMFSEAIKPVPAYQSEKSTLQRAVQILKRHRDMMFSGNDDKPISIIITTLAGLTYQKEENLADAILGIINRMPSAIEEKYSVKHGKNIKWIANPVNPEENFADKWPENERKQTNFYNWMRQLDHDMNDLFMGRGMDQIKLSLQGPIGLKTMNEAISKVADEDYKAQIQGQQRMAKITGTLGASGIVVPDHNFHGNE